jgi:hypothetical protein
MTGSSGVSSTPRLLDSFIGISGILDHPPSRVMTAGHNSAISPRVFARGLILKSRPLERGRRECRALDAPAAWRAEKQAAPVVHVTTVTPETPSIPRTMVYSLLRALSGEPGFFATVISGIASTDLDTSVGVSGPHDFTVRLGYLRLGTFRVHRILPRVIDVAQRPSSGTGRRVYKGDLGASSSNISEFQN